MAIQIVMSYISQQVTSSHMWYLIMLQIQTCCNNDITTQHNNIK